MRALEDFAAIYAENHARVFAWVRRWVDDYEDALDLTASTFSNALAALPRYRDDASISTWLYRIARNLCNNYLRGKAFRQKFHAFSLNQVEHSDALLLPIEEYDPIEAFSKIELQKEVQLAWTKLPFCYQQVLLLRDVEGLRSTELAEKLHVTERAVRTKVFRARKKLRTLLRKE